MECIDNNCEINVEIAGIETKIQFETQCSIIDGKMVGLYKGTQVPSAVFAPLQEVMLMTCSISRKDFILTKTMKVVEELGRS